MVIAALFTIAKTCKQPKCPSKDELVKKMWYVCIYIYTHTHTYIYICIYTHTKTYYLAIKKNEILSSATRWMDLEIITLGGPKSLNVFFRKMALVALSCL